MKTLLLSIFAFTLMACSSTVQVANECDPPQDATLIEMGIVGTLYNVQLRFFDENDNMVKTENLGNLKIGSKSEKIKAPKKASYYRIWATIVDVNTVFGKWVKENQPNDYSLYTIEHSPIESGNNFYIMNGETLTR